MIREFNIPLPMENSAHPQSSRAALNGGYEPTDVNIRGVLVFLGILLATVVIVQLVITSISRHFAYRASQLDKQILRGQVLPSVAASRAYFPYPREQISPLADLQMFRAQEETELNSYGWIDRKAGVVRIPIDRAMDLIVQRGLPVAAGTNGNKTGPSSLQLQQQRPLQFTPSGQEEKP
jgi:hypothetical protein